MCIYHFIDHICKYEAPTFDDFTELFDHGPTVSKYSYAGDTMKWLVCAKLSTQSWYAVITDQMQTVETQHCYYFLTKRKGC